MISCLGFCVNNNIVKYAKMTMDNNKNITLENFGVRYVKESLKKVLSNIVDETNSSKDLIAINTQNDIFVNYTMFNQPNVKNSYADVAKLEFESWCEKNAKVPSKYSYSYKVSNVVNNENKYNAVLNIIEKDTINEYNDIGIAKLSNMLPVQFLMNRLVPQDESNYILVNLDERLSISVVNKNNLVEFKSYEFGMGELVSKFAEKIGSYQKAYEACKQLNVFSDEETNNDKKLEEIAEPVLQEILKSVAVMVNKYRDSVTKVILAGEGIVFTNIDVLFREYLNIKCDILKPEFLRDTSNVRNLAEALETTPAMAIALESISPRELNLNYIKNSSKIRSKFDKMATKDKKMQQKAEKNEKTHTEKVNKNVQKNTNLGLHEDHTLSYITCACIVCTLVLVAYTVFTLVYSSSVTKSLNNLEIAKNKVTEQIKVADEDITYVSTNLKKYKDINDKVQEIVEDIEETKINKYSTYNVASFLQKMIKVTPKNVQILTIKSDDNKKITMRVRSVSYPALGYFLTELKQNGPLNNVTINNVENSTLTVVEIGGELP